MRKSFLLLTLCILSLLLSAVAKAGGNLSVDGVAARAQSMQAFTAVADDPSAIYYNPGGLTQIPGTEIDASAALIFPNQRYTNNVNNLTTYSKQFALGPSLFFSTDNVEPVVLGMGVYAPFAKSADYEPVNAAIANLPQKASFVRLDFVPTIAMALNSYVSLGASFVVSRVLFNQNILGFDETGSGWGYTGQGGIMVYCTPAVKAGVDLRGPETVNASGVGTLNTGLSGNFTTQIKLPAILSLGIAWQANKALLLTAEYANEMWSTFHQIVRNYDNPILSAMGVTPIQARNSDDIRVGILYTYKKYNEIRVGYSYRQAAVPSENIVPAEPDYNSNSFAVGYSRYYKRFRLDAGYQYSIALQTNSTNPFFPGSYGAKVGTFLVGIGYDV